MGTGTLSPPMPQALARGLAPSPVPAPLAEPTFDSSGCTKTIRKALVETCRYPCFPCAAGPMDGNHSCFRRKKPNLTYGFCLILTSKSTSKICVLAKDSLKASARTAAPATWGPVGSIASEQWPGLIPAQGKSLAVALGESLGLPFTVVCQRGTSSIIGESQGDSWERVQSVRMYHSAVSGQRCLHVGNADSHDSPNLAGAVQHSMTKAEVL